MTYLQSLQQLRERVSKLEGPDREVDHDIAEAFGLEFKPKGATREHNEWYSKYYTASIDAALALVERVLGPVGDAFALTLIQDYGAHHRVRLHVDAGPQVMGPGKQYIADAATPALAILLALLDAMISEKAKAEEPT